MIDHHIVEALIDMAYFLEFSDRSQIDEDAAVAALEQLSSELIQVAHDDKAELISAIISIAPTYGDKADFVRNLPGFLGLFD